MPTDLQIVLRGCRLKTKTIMKKFFLLAVLILTASNIFSNINLREDNGKTSVAVKGGVIMTGNKSATVGVEVNQSYDWFTFGADANVAFNGCFSSTIKGGPKFGKNFYIAPELTLGLAQVRENSEYINTENGDIFRTNRPAPRLTLGGEIRLGYNWKNVEIFCNIGYKRAFKYSQSQMLQDPWQQTGYQSGKHNLYAELGLAYNISEEAMAVEKRLKLGVNGGYSSEGLFAGLEAYSFDRISWSWGHSYGGFANFYLQNGAAEIGAKYMLSCYPIGSNSIYSFAFGPEIAMGMYPRQWGGIAMEDASRFQTAWNVYSLGGRFGLNVAPVALQLGRSNISLNGGIGVIVLNKVTSVENPYDFDFSVSSEKVRACWNVSLKFAYAFK
jgi:hypothetical protein